MKKLTIVAGLGLLATVGAVFAAWTFDTSGTSFETTAKEVTVTIDDSVTHTGNHGTLVLTKPSVPALKISQSSDKQSAAWYTVVDDALVAYTPSGDITLTYTPALDEDEPLVFNYKVSWTLSITQDMYDAGITINDTTDLTVSGDLYVAQSRLSSSVSWASVLGNVKFPSLTNYTDAKAFTDALNAAGADVGIKVEFALVPNPADATLGSDQAGYRYNGANLVGMEWNQDGDGYKEYKLLNCSMVAGDVLQFHWGNDPTAVDFAPIIEEGGASANFEKVTLQSKDYIRCKVAGTYNFYYKSYAEAKLYIGQ